MSKMPETAKAARNAYLKAKRKTDPEFREKERQRQIRFWTRKAEELEKQAEQEQATPTMTL